MICPVSLLSKTQADRIGVRMQRIAALVQHSANDRLERAVIPTPVLLLLLSVIPRAVEGPARSDSFCSAVPGKSLRVDPSTTRQKNAVRLGRQKKNVEALSTGW